MRHDLPQQTNRVDLFSGFTSQCAGVQNSSTRTRTRSMSQLHRAIRYPRYVKYPHREL